MPSLRWCVRVCVLVFVLALYTHLEFLHRCKSLLSLSLLLAQSCIDFLRSSASSQASAIKSGPPPQGSPAPPRPEFIQAVSRALKASDSPALAPLAREVRCALLCCLLTCASRHSRVSIRSTRRLLVFVRTHC